MVVSARYRSGALLSYSLVAYSPSEGLRVAITGDKGRVEVYERHSAHVIEQTPTGEGTGADRASDERRIRLFPMFRSPPSTSRSRPGRARTPATAWCSSSCSRPARRPIHGAGPRPISTVPRRCCSARPRTGHWPAASRWPSTGCRPAAGEVMAAPESRPFLVTVRTGAWGAGHRHRQDRRCLCPLHQCERAPRSAAGPLAWPPKAFVPRRIPPRARRLGAQPVGHDGRCPAAGW